MRPNTLIGFVLLVACDRAPSAGPAGAAPTPPSSAPAISSPLAASATGATAAATADASPSATASASASPAPSSSAALGQRVYPPLDTTCAADADCIITSDEIADSPPRTYTCCGGCTNRAGSRAWHTQFLAACAKSRPPMCPPLGCAMVAMRATCKSGRCTAVEAK